MINFIKTDSPGLGEIDLSREISRLLAEDKKVLWIISGGSNIGIEATIMRQLDQSKTNNLMIILGDERYGQKGHKDSNEQQLEANGFYIGNATLTPILEEKPLADTTEDYGHKLSQLFEWADEVIGQFGIGDDGHTAGVLPGSVGVENKEMAVSYRAEDFTRVTMTLESIKKLTKAYVFCFGKSKQTAISNLKDRTSDINDCPSLVFYNIPSVYVYNDLVGDKE